MKIVKPTHFARARGAIECCTAMRDVKLCTPSSDTLMGISDAFTAIGKPDIVWRADGIDLRCIKESLLLPKLIMYLITIVVNLLRSKYDFDTA